MNNATITIVGNVTRDPELRFTANGMATVTFSVAVNRRIPGRNNASPTDVVSYISVVAWQQLAENVAESLQRGTRVVVTGRLDQRIWETANAERRTTFELVAEDIGTSLKWASATVQKVKRPVPTAEQLEQVVFGSEDADHSSHNATSELSASLGHPVLVPSLDHSGDVPF
jgi:single-strand DNA-binding protein